MEFIGGYNEITQKHAYIQSFGTIPVQGMNLIRGNFNRISLISRTLPFTSFAKPLPTYKTQAPFNQSVQKIKQEKNNSFDL